MLAIMIGEVQLDLFLQTSEQEGFFVMAKNLDMREVMAEEGRNMDELPDGLMFRLCLNLTYTG